MNTSTIKTTFSTKNLVLVGLFTAITCILAPFSIPIPISPVPISLTNLVLYISIFILGWKLATLSYTVYVFLGLIGLPVFSGFTGGPSKLAGPTGGYLIGFFFLIIIAGIFIEKFRGKKILYITGMVLGTIICYLFGTLWLSMQLSMSFIQGLTIGVFPYIIGDSVKIIIAMFLGPILTTRLKNIR